MGSKCVWKIVGCVYYWELTTVWHISKRGAMAIVAIYLLFYHTTDAMLVGLFFLFFLMLNHKIGQFDCRKIDTRKAYARIPLNGLYNVIAILHFGRFMTLVEIEWRFSQFWILRGFVYAVSLIELNFSVWILLCAANWIAFPLRVQIMVEPRSHAIVDVQIKEWLQMN